MRVILLLFCFALAGTLQGAELQFSFGEMSLNGSLTNFHAVLLGSGAPPAWKIVEDEVPSVLAPLTDRAQNVARRSVLAQTSRDTTDERFPMYVYDAEKFRDFKLTTRFKIVGGVAEQMAGVVFRFQNASNFYVVRVSALGNNIGFYKVVNGERITPVILPAQISTNVWHDLAVDCSGVYIECSLDGKKALPTITDKSPPDGKIGFWTKSDAVSYFADATVTYTPIIPAAQALVNSVMRQQPRVLGLWLYTLADHETASIIASKDGVDLGQLGTEAELGAIRDGTIYFGREHGAVLITMPLHDRNGENIAAVRFKLESFFGETQKNALVRATMLQKLMQELCTSVEDLAKINERGMTAILPRRVSAANTCIWFDAASRWLSSPDRGGGAEFGERQLALCRGADNRGVPRRGRANLPCFFNRRSSGGRNLGTPPYQPQRGCIVQPSVGATRLRWVAAKI